MTLSKRLGAIATLILLGAMSRLIPHPPNFTSIAALALFSGAQMSENKFLSFFIPIAALLLSDIIIGFHGLMPVIYFAFGLIVILGHFTGASRKPTSLILTSFFASCIFFLLSNFAVWAWGTMYSHDIWGLAACYFAALPFFGNFLLGTIMYGAILFGTLSGLEHFIPSLRKDPEAVLSRVSG